jgi:hypothetical protein
VDDLNVSLPALVGRLIAVLFPSGVQAERVGSLPRVMLHLQAAVDLARGVEPALPLGAMFAHAPVKAPTKPRKETAENRRARLKIELSDAEAHPFGLVPDRTIGLVVGCDWSTVASYRQGHGIEPLTGPGASLTTDERWSELLAVWGEASARAWFERFAKRQDARRQHRAFEAWLAKRGAS